MSPHNCNETTSTGLLMEGVRTTSRLQASAQRRETNLE
jgi:hypothetical protein